MFLEKQWKNLEKSSMSVEDVWEKIPLSVWKYNYGEETII